MIRQKPNRIPRKSAVRARLLPEVFHLSRDCPRAATSRGRSRASICSAMRKRTTGSSASRRFRNASIKERSSSEIVLRTGLKRSRVLRGLPQRLDVLQRAFVHHNGAGDEISQALALLAEQHARDAHGVESGKLIHDPQQVASHRFDRRDRPAGFLDHADSAAGVCPASGRSIWLRKSQNIRNKP